MKRVYGAYYPEKLSRSVTAISKRIDFVMDNENIYFMGDSRKLPEEYVKEIMIHIREAIDRYLAYPRTEGDVVVIKKVEL